MASQTTRRIKALVPALLTWFKTNARDLPWRCTRDPYAIWISEIMLQQTQVQTVIPYWRRWMRELPTVQSLARARQFSWERTARMTREVYIEAQRRFYA